MKKLFTFVAVLLLAITASADVIWSESLDRNGTYINKSDFEGGWPYANQWYAKGNFAMDYDSVKSNSCSVRNKKINGASENSIGFFFTASKGANNDAYLQLYGVNAVVGADAKLIFDISSDSEVIPDSIHKYIEIIQDGKKLVVPALESATATLTTVKVEVPMNAGTIDKLFINKIRATAGGVFITSLRIEGISENAKITLSASHKRGGEVAGGGSLKKGENHEISATANEGWEFVEWSDGVKDNPRTINLTKDTSFVAQFKRTGEESFAWSESLDKNGTYIPKGDSLPWRDNWPYAEQWYAKGNYAEEYEAVLSKFASIRNRKLNGITEGDGTIGFYFAASKDGIYLKLDGMAVNTTGNSKLIFDLSSADEVNTADVNSYFHISQDGQALVVPAIKTASQAEYTTEVVVPLNAGSVDQLIFTMDKITMAMFMTSVRIEISTANENVFVNTKATKTVKNGQVVILRNGVYYNAIGTIVDLK